MTNKIVGDEREREFLALCELSRKSADLPDVRNPDRHLDILEIGQLCVDGKKFDFAWYAEHVIVELDGGQFSPGGGRHNSDADRWKTLRAQRLGWRVVHISYTMLKYNPGAILDALAKMLG